MSFASLKMDQALPDFNFSETWDPDLKVGSGPTRLKLLHFVQGARLGLVEGGPAFAMQCTGRFGRNRSSASSAFMSPERLVAATGSTPGYLSSSKSLYVKSYRLMRSALMVSLARRIAKSLGG